MKFKMSQVFFSFLIITQIFKGFIHVKKLS